MLDQIAALISGRGTWTERPETRPSVAIEDSVEPGRITCLETGARFALLRRHLRERFGMTADSYRQKWALPQDYPMVSPDYAAQKKAFLDDQARNEQQTAENRPNIMQHLIVEPRYPST